MTLVAVMIGRGLILLLVYGFGINARSGPIFLVMDVTNKLLCNGEIIFMLVIIKFWRVNMYLTMDGSVQDI